MRILIIEDEHYAAKRLQSLISAELPNAQILEVIDTVEESIEWLSNHIEPNLIFMDIQLADGLSFQIFDRIKISCPIIFTTAYDEYALNAFKVNSIDYILKPIEDNALRVAINKYQQIYPSGNGTNNAAEINWKNITKDIFQSRDHYKQRFLVKVGNAYTYLNTKDIRLVYSEDGLSFALNKDYKKILLEYSLDKIHSQLDPNQFFRTSRKHIVSIDGIQKIHPYLNSRLKIDIGKELSDPLIVSREKVKEFKSWLDS